MEPALPSRGLNLYFRGQGTPAPRAPWIRPDKLQTQGRAHSSLLLMPDVIVTNKTVDQTAFRLIIRRQKTLPDHMKRNSEPADAPSGRESPTATKKVCLSFVFALYSTPKRIFCPRSAVLLTSLEFSLSMSASLGWTRATSQATAAARRH